MEDGPGSKIICEHAEVGQQDGDRCRAGQKERSEDGSEVRCQAKAKAELKLVESVRGDRSQLEDLY